MGVAPTPAMGRISASPPGVHTGNIDNKDLVAGTTLFMPVYAVGALFSVGDAHAAQGQGEVDLSAIETGNRGKFQFILRKDMKLTWPRGETPTHWMVMGLNPNLEEAMKIAVRETIRTQHKSITIRLLHGFFAFSVSLSFSVPSAKRCRELQAGDKPQWHG